MAVPIPAQITQAQLATYKGQGYEDLAIGASPGWKASWGAWEGIRDLVQNALDATEDFRILRTADGVEITDTGPGFPVRAFLLGGGSKADYMSGLRGLYGEGLKIAVLTLLRAGYAISFKTAGQGAPQQGAATLVETPLGGKSEQILHFLYEPIGPPRGTSWIIHGYTGPLFEDRFITKRSTVTVRVDSSIPDPSRLPARREDQLFAGRGRVPAGRLYVRDVYVKDIASEVSYNLWDVRLVDDRNAPASNAELQTALGVFWSKVRDPKWLRWLLEHLEEQAKPSFEKETVRFRGDVARQNLSDGTRLWQEAFRQAFGARAVVAAYGKDQLLIHEGYKPIHFDSNVSSWIAYATQLNGEDVLIRLNEERKRKRVIVLPEELNAKRRMVLLLIQGINEALRVEYPQVERTVTTGVPARKWAAPAWAPVAAMRGVTDAVGFYDPATNRIEIREDQLDDVEHALDIYIHEAAHFISGWDDGDERHTQAISLVGAMVSMLFLKGKGLGQAAEMTPQPKQRLTQYGTPVRPAAPGEQVQDITQYLDAQLPVWPQLSPAAIDYELSKLRRAGRFKALTGPGPVEVGGARVSGVIH